MNVTFPGAAREIAGSCYLGEAGMTRFTAACLVRTGFGVGLRPLCNFAPGKTVRIARAAERDFFRGIPTSYSLPAETVDQLRALGPRLIGESADYQSLLRDLQRK